MKPEKQQIRYPMITVPLFNWVWFSDPPQARQDSSIAMIMVSPGSSISGTCQETKCFFFKQLRLNDNFSISENTPFFPKSKLLRAKKLVCIHCIHCIYIFIALTFAFTLYILQQYIIELSIYIISAFWGFWEVFSHSFQPTVTNGASSIY